MTDDRQIPGTHLFDGRASRRGYALNKMCFSLNRAANRDAFAADPVAYCRTFGLDEATISLIEERDILGLVHAGGSIYYLAKLAGIIGWDVQDVGAQQTGTSKAEFQAMLEAAGE